MHPVKRIEYVCEPRPPLLLILINTHAAKSTTVSQHPQGERGESETERRPHVKRGFDRDAPPSGVHFKLSFPLQLSPFQFTRLPSLFLHSQGRGETPLPECGNVTWKTTRGQWIQVISEQTRQQIKKATYRKGEVGVHVLRLKSFYTHLICWARPLWEAWVNSRAGTLG